MSKTPLPHSLNRSIGIIRTRVGLPPRFHPHPRLRGRLRRFPKITTQFVTAASGEREREREGRGERKQLSAELFVRALPGWPDRLSPLSLSLSLSLSAPKVTMTDAYYSLCSYTSKAASEGVREGNRVNPGGDGGSLESPFGPISASWVGRISWQGAAPPCCSSSRRRRRRRFSCFALNKTCSSCLRARAPTQSEAPAC